MTTVTWSRSVSAEHKARLKKLAGDACNLRSELEELSVDISATAESSEDEDEVDGLVEQIADLAAEVEPIEGELDDLVEELVGE